MMHRLKTLPEFYEPLCSGVKKFEIRKNDRDFKVGDHLILNEYIGKCYSGRWLLFKVVYITDYAQQSGYVVMGLE